jgi:hypothetical protein
MSKELHLRKLADLYRRMASIPTSGGHRADRALVVLAAKLDREIVALQVQDASQHQSLDVGKPGSGTSPSRQARR